MTELILMNGKQVEVSETEVEEFITVAPLVPTLMLHNKMLAPNPTWQHSGQLTEQEVMRFLKKQSSYGELQRVARYIVVYAENTALAGYLFDKAEGITDGTKEFNMPVLKKLRELYHQAIDNSQNTIDLYPTVLEMENRCMEIGLDPL